MNFVGNDGKSNPSKLKVIEGEIKRMREKYLTDKREQKVLFDTMYTLSKEREDVLENLKGKYCIRLFCKFNHRNVFTKVNIHSTKVPENPTECQYLCDECLWRCGNILESNHELENHIQNSHEEPVENKTMDFKCRDCSFVSDTRSALNSHVISYHKDDEI